MTSYYAKIARYYDALNSDQIADIPLYLDTAAATGGPVLDVGCGSGRILYPLLAVGYETHGIELDSTMLALAEKRAASLPATARSRLSLFHADATKYTLPTTYRLILLSYHMLMHFQEQDTQIQLLQNLAEAAQPGTSLIIDLPHPGEAFATPNTDKIQHERDILDPDSGHLVQVSSISHLELSTQLLDVTWIFDEIGEGSQVLRTVARQHLRYFTKAELSLLLRISGWQEVAVYGDYDRRPFTDDEERMLVFAVLP